MLSWNCYCRTLKPTQKLAIVMSNTQVHLTVALILSGYIKIPTAGVFDPAECSEKGSDQLCQDGCKQRAFTGRLWFMSPTVSTYTKEIFLVWLTRDVTGGLVLGFFSHRRKRAGNALFSLKALGNVYLLFKQTAGAIEVGCMSFLKHYYVFFPPVNFSCCLGT